MQRLAKVGARGFRIALRPERFHDLRPMHAVSRSKREQLHHVRRATAPPRVTRDGGAVYRDREPAEKLDRHLLHRSESYGTSPAPASPPGGTVAERLPP